MSYKTSSRISKTGLAKKGFTPKKWMALVLVGIIAFLGLIIIYRSFASPLPQDVINNVKVEVMADGRAKVTESSLGYERIFNQVDTARAISDQNYYNELMQKVLVDLQKLYDQKHPSPPPNNSPPPANPIQPTQPQAPQPSSPSSPGAGSGPGGGQSGGSSSGSNPGSASGGSGSSSPQQPSAGTNPGTNIASGDKTQQTINSLKFDTQDPSTLPTFSGTTEFVFTPPTNYAQARTVGVYVDRKLVQYFEPKKQQFSIDTTRLSNGPHRLDVVVFGTDQQEQAHFAYAFNVQNSSNILRQIFNFVSTPFVSP